MSELAKCRLAASEDVAVAAASDRPEFVVRSGECDTMHGTLLGGAAASVVPAEVDSATRLDRRKWPGCKTRSETSDVSDLGGSTTAGDEAGEEVVIRCCTADCVCSST